MSQSAAPPRSWPFLKVGQFWQTNLSGWQTSRKTKASKAASVGGLFRRSRVALQNSRLLDSRAKSAIVFSLMVEGCGAHMQRTDKPWRRTDAKKGNHRPRRMGHDGSLGNGTSCARASSVTGEYSCPLVIRSRLIGLRR